MSWSANTSAIRVGDTVTSADGHNIGSVSEVHPGYIVVKKGLVFATDHFIPPSAVASAGNGQVVLNVSRDGALQSGWGAAPLNLNSEVGSVATAVDDRILVEDDSADRPVSVQEMAVGEELRIPLFEEELTETVRQVEGGAVRIERRIVSDIPATEDEIRVERRIVDRPAAAGGTEAVEQIIIEVPLQQELVDLETQGNAAEEIVVTKGVIQRNERVTDIVRREEVTIDEGDGVMSDRG